MPFKRIFSGLYIFSFVCVLAYSSPIAAQISLYPSPRKGFEKRITKYVNKLHVVNTHEHLMMPDSLGSWSSLDFMLLFSSYSYDDMISAGMSKSEYFRLVKEPVSVKEKWEIIAPYWEKAKNTAYCRNSLLIAKELYGVKELNASTVELVSKKIFDAYKNPDWLYQLYDKAKIDYCITDGYWIPGGGPRGLKGDRFRFVARFDEYVTIWSGSTISKLSKKTNFEIKTLANLENALVNAVDYAVNKQIVGFKSGIAYSRTLVFEDVKREKAEQVFNEMLTKGQSADAKQLQDYMMHQLILQAEKHKIPMVFHTGLHAGQGNIIENSKPVHLVNLVRQYPNVNFVFYHGGFPYGGELTTIVKNFPNAWLDLSWLYIISPSYAGNYLHEWLETIPANKIMAFGGDGRHGEGTYGHLRIAKQIVSQVLIEKVRTGYFSEQEAKDIAKMMFYDNAVNVYKLK